MEYEISSDLKGVVRRRKWLFFALFSSVLIGGLAVCVLTPPVFRSQAIILFDDDRSPQMGSRRWGDSVVSERLEVLSQQVLSRSKLLEICDRFGLFLDEGGTGSPEERSTKFQKALQIKPVESPMADTSSRKPASSAVAFSIAFENRDPTVAQRVTEALANLYISENIKTRVRQMSDSTQVLEGEVLTLEKKIETQSAKLSAFKSAHWGELPEHAKLNIQSLERLDSELGRVVAQISALEQRKIYLEGQLLTIEPTIMVDIPPAPKPTTESSQKITELRLKKIELEARVSPEHPDLKRIKRELGEMESQARDQARTQLERMQAKLTEMTREATVYGPGHPDGLRLKAEIEAITREVDRLKAQGEGVEAVPEPQKRINDNPSFINVKTQLASTELEIKGRHLEKDRIREKIAEYETLLLRSPGVEREYEALSGELETLRRRHQEVRAKLSEANLDNQVQQVEQGARFTVVDPAATSNRPVRPNRTAMLLLSFALAIGAAFGGVALSEACDQSIRSTDELKDICGVPMLGIFPVVSTYEEKQTQRFRLTALLLLLLVLLAALVSWARENPQYIEKVRKHIYLPWDIR